MEADKSNTRKYMLLMIQISNCIKAWGWWNLGILQRSSWVSKHICRPKIGRIGHLDTRIKEEDSRGDLESKRKKHLKRLEMGILWSLTFLEEERREGWRKWDCRKLLRRWRWRRGGEERNEGFMRNIRSWHRPLRRCWWGFRSVLNQNTSLDGNYEMPLAKENPVPHVAVLNSLLMSCKNSKERTRAKPFF